MARYDAHRSEGMFSRLSARASAGATAFGFLDIVWAYVSVPTIAIVLRSATIHSGLSYWSDYFRPEGRATRPGYSTGWIAERLYGILAEREQSTTGTSRNDPSAPAPTSSLDTSGPSPICVPERLPATRGSLRPL